MVPEEPVDQPSDADDSSIEISEHGSLDGTVALRDSPQELSSFGDISVINSSDVHFGNKTFYQGPVTIKQFVYPNDVPKNTAVSDCDREIVLNIRTNANGVDNPVYVQDFPILNDNPSTLIEDSGNLKGDSHLLDKCFKGNVVIIVLILALVIFSTIATVWIIRSNVSNEPLNKKKNDESPTIKPIDAPSDPNANLTLPGKLKLVTRLEWLAQPPMEPANKLSLPVPYVIIHHTATENCSSQAQCRFHVRYIQMFHVESLGWWDIGYNFLVGGDGEAYEGRGWTKEGAHLYGYNDKSLGIAFIGTFMNILPPLRQITACKQLIAKGVQSGYIRKDYKLLAARQLQTTQSPGTLLYEEMKTWDHWAASP